MSEAPLHVPVMNREIISYLKLEPGDRVVDCTLGMGGHSFEIAKIIGPQGRLIAIDRDNESLSVAKERLKEFCDRCTFVQSDFRRIDEVLSSLEIQEVDGMLFDLGISSYQLDNSSRGFSLKNDGPLDMRMDKDSYISAQDLVNSLSEKEISSILKNFGEERWHNRIARFLVQQRAKNPIESTQDLSDLVMQAIPRRFQNQKIHPATRTFQAFRIAVNRELEALEIALDKCVDYLKKGARLCVISFHSLEDRIVKEKFRQFLKEGKFTLIEKKPLRPTFEETCDNPRSRSARLRIAERI